MEESQEEKSHLITRWLDEGKEFTAELIKENERLRLLVATLKSEKNIPKQTIDDLETSQGRISQLELERERFQEELDQLRKTLSEVEAENKEFADKYIKVEEQNQNMASLYVASYRLHSTLDLEQVIEIIKEIIINLVGSEVFAIFMKDPRDDSLKAIAAEGKSVRKFQPIQVGVGVAGLAAQKGRQYVSEKDSPLEGEPIACVPLMVQDKLYGLIAIYKLLRQKDGFKPVDIELFGLLADHAAAAIYSSQLHTQSERKLNTLQSFLNLLKPETETKTGSS